MFVVSYSTTVPLPITLMAAMTWLSSAAVAKSESPAVAEPAASTAKHHWFTGEGVNFGDVIFPHAHFQAVYGQTTAADHASSSDHGPTGHHDPAQDGWTIQGLEIGASFRPVPIFEAFTTYHLYQNANTRQWRGEFEEWFGKIKLSDVGLELRGGRYLNRFGLHNSSHLHGWNFIDNHLVNGRFLGDDALTSSGAELNWILPIPWTSMISFSIGDAQGHKAHSHGHVHHEESRFEGEDALFQDTIYVFNWTNQYDYNDFHQYQFGFSGAWGDHAMNDSTSVYGIHLQYQWRQNGYLPGGRYFRWRSEAMWRRIQYPYVLHEEEQTVHEAHQPHPHQDHTEEHESIRHGSSNEWGAYTSLIYGFDHGLELGLRGEYVSGVKDAGLESRYRISPNITYYLNPTRTFYLRTQYNFDHSPTSKDDHAIWLQVGFNWGGAEIR